MKKIIVVTLSLLMFGFMGVYAQGVSKSVPKNEKEAKKQMVEILKDNDPTQSKSQNAKAVRRAVEHNKVTAELVIKGQASVRDYQIVIPKGITYSVNSGGKNITVEENFLHK